MYAFDSGRRGRRGGEGMRGLGLGFTNPGGTRGVLTCVCVRILCVDGRSMYLYIVLGGYLRILCAPSVQS